MTPPRVVALDRGSFAAHRDAVLKVYSDAMNVPERAASSRRSILREHTARGGLRAFGAFQDDELVGIAYGYLGAPGQWWHDQVQAALSPEDGRRWLDGAFEVCELHVRTRLQGTGLGRQLLDRLLASTPARTAVLTTPDGETRARGFYRAGGWVELVTALTFPGDPRTFAVLALPLAEPT